MIAYEMMLPTLEEADRQPASMGRRSSDSEDDSRSRRKKKQRRRSSSSSSSSSSSNSKVVSSRSRKSTRLNRSRSRDKDKDRRRRRRSSSSSSHSSSRKRRSRSAERDKGRSHHSHRSRSRDRRRAHFVIGLAVSEEQVGWAGGVLGGGGGVGGLSGQNLMIDTQIGYEVLPATPTPTRHHLQNMKKRGARRGRVHRLERREAHKDDVASHHCGITGTSLGELGGAA
ncbi:hypothetical protein NQZ68_012273 [Dissostichus eleginoides]|nr:hypothetical protein NQZ68_012273 [Dissostichus eleginoides]